MSSPGSVGRAVERLFALGVVSFLLILRGQLEQPAESCVEDARVLGVDMVLLRGFGSAWNIRTTRFEGEPRTCDGQLFAAHCEADVTTRAAHGLQSRS